MQPQGEVPSNMKAFWKFLLRKALPADSLKQVAAAVFGLGDSGAFWPFVPCSSALSCQTCKLSCLLAAA